jgi:diguanylate cyclase (GGDEF)-like protein
MALAETDVLRSHAIALRAQAEADLDRAVLNVAFSPELEQRFRQDTAAERLRELRGKSIFCAFLYSSVTLLLDFLVVLDPIWRNVAVQVTVTPLIGMIISWTWFRSGISDRARELAALGASLAYTLSVIITVYLSPPEALAHNMVLVALPVNFVMVFIHLRLRHAATFLAVSILSLAAAVYTRSDLAAAQQAFPVGFVAALCGPTLLVVRQYERSRRQIYLHGLQQRLHIEHLAAENASLAELSTTDPLTGAANRRRLDRDLKMFCAKPRATGAFLLIDIDGFKAFNDRYGHLAGDNCLKEIANCMANQLRRCDLLARFGGEEFAVLMPDVQESEAMDAAERLRQAVEDNRFVIEGQFVRVTISIGVADVAACPEPTLLLGASDAALYAAKKSGRNRVCAAWLEAAKA